jgi:hypothetical protein
MQVHFFEQQQQADTSLLEDLDVSDLSGELSAELTFLVKEVLNEGLVLSVGGISLAPGVGVAVLAHLNREFRGTVSSTNHEDSVDLRVVVLTKGDDDTEGILAGRLETLDESTGQVGGHEHLGQVLVEEVVSEPDGPSIGLVVLPEPGNDGTTDILQVVGVNALELLQVELGGGKQVQWVGGLLDGLLLIVVLLAGSSGGSSGRGGGSSSGGRGGLGDEDLSLGAQVQRTSNGSKVGLTNNGREPTDDIGEGLAELGIEDHAETCEERAAQDNIGEGDGLSNQIGVSQQVVVQDGQQLGQILLRGLSSGSVELEVAQDGVDPDTEGSIDLGAPVDPGINNGSLIGGSSIQDASLASDYTFRQKQTTSKGTNSLLG